MSAPRWFPILGISALALFQSLELFAADADLVAMVKKSDGAFTPELRAEFLRNAEQAVVKELADVKVSLSNEQRDFVRNDPVLRDACYATIHPPDPRILLNILEMREEAGPEFFKKYENYFVGAAVVRRFAGVDEGAFGDKEEWELRSKSEAEEKTGVRRWPDYSVVDIVAPDSEGGAAKKKKTPKSRLVKKREEKWEKHESKMTDDEGLDVIAAFLKEKKITPRQLNESADLKKELLARMGDKAPKFGAINYELLYKVMTREGLRPAERDPFPSAVEFARYLDSIKPRFPVTTAPWPVLMPLAKGWPLRESSNIWERVEKGGKLPTYGKYHGKELVIAARLEPFPWHWNSWQGTYQAGGVCHEMSTIGLGTYMSVGVPSDKAGQPHHSCVLVYSHSDKGYFVGTKQGTHGPADTHSQWLFADPKPETPESFQMGLALSMNVGLTQYMDTRIAVHLADILAERNEPALAEKVLRSAARINPFNTQVWRALLDLRVPEKNPALQKAELINLLTSLISSSVEDVLNYKDKPTDVSLENETDEDFSDVGPKKWSSTYASVIGKTMLMPGLRPTSDAATNAKILRLLQASASGGIDLKNVIADFETAAGKAKP